MHTKWETPSTAIDYKKMMRPPPVGFSPSDCRDLTETDATKDRDCIVGVIQRSLYKYLMITMRWGSTQCSTNPSSPVRAREELQLLKCQVGRNSELLPCVFMREGYVKVVSAFRGPYNKHSRLGPGVCRP